MSHLKPGRIITHDGKLYRYWKQLPVTGSTNHILICTRPDGAGGWNGPQVAIPLSDTVAIVEPMHAAGAR